MPDSDDSERRVAVPKPAPASAMSVHPSPTGPSMPRRSLTGSTSNRSQPHKIALVTGAAQGIGRAIAIRLAEDGFDVAINDLEPKKDLLEGLLNEISTQGCRPCVVCADVSVEAQVKDMVDTVVETLGGLDVVRVLCSPDHMVWLVPLRP